MKLFEHDKLQYLYDLASEVGGITIQPDFMFDLIINADGNGPGIGVYLLRDGDKIASFDFDLKGIAKGLSMLRLVQKMPHSALMAMRDNHRGY